MKKMVEIILCMIIAWLSSCVFIQLTAWCFGYIITLRGATGIWFVILILKDIVSATRKK